MASLGKTNKLILDQALEDFENISTENINSFDVNDFEINFLRGLDLEDGASTITDFTSSIIANKLLEDTKKLSNAIMKIVDLSPKGIIDHLALKKPIYTKTSCYGHFGRTPKEDGSFSWEKLDLAEKLLSELS